VLTGVDIFVHWPGTNPNELADIVRQLDSSFATLSMITNRGIKVWPEGFEETFCTDHWRCRFKPNTKKTISKSDIVSLLSKAITLNIDVIKTENLYEFDGKAAYSLGQGQ
jgi:isocitrate dehydrogenase